MLSHLFQMNLMKMKEAKTLTRVAKMSPKMSVLQMSHLRVSNSLQRARSELQIEVPLVDHLPKFLNQMIPPKRGPYLARSEATQYPTSLLPPKYRRAPDHQVQFDLRFHLECFDLSLRDLLVPQLGQEVQSKSALKSLGNRLWHLSLLQMRRKLLSLRSNGLFKSMLVGKQNRIILRMMKMNEYDRNCKEILKPSKILKTSSIIKTMRKMPVNQV